MAKASPRPWKKDGRFIVDANGDPICDLDHWFTPLDQKNADLVVAAVNSYDRLKGVVAAHQLDTGSCGSGEADRTIPIDDELREKIQGLADRLSGR